MKLDRLVWADGLCFVAYGLKIGIRTNAPEFLPRVTECVPAGWTAVPVSPVELLYSVIIGGSGPRPGVRRYSLLYRGAVRLGRTMEPKELLPVFDSDLRLSVAELARRRVFVHAGVVGWHGKAILLPGPSHSGKSNLVAELVRAGATYYSDEYAVLDRFGRVFPFGDKLSIRPGTGQHQRRVSAEDMGGKPGKRPLPVGLVLVTKYKPGARWRPRELSPGTAMLQLLLNTVPARRKPRAVLTALRAAVTGARLLQSHRGEAAAIIHALLDEVVQQPPEHLAEAANVSQEARRQARRGRTSR